jgi:hypothetical protein
MVSLYLWHLCHPHWYNGDDCHHGYICVVAENINEAMEKAAKKLQDAGFGEIPFSGQINKRDAIICEDGIFLNE